MNPPCPRCRGLMRKIGLKPINDAAPTYAVWVWECKAGCPGEERTIARELGRSWERRRES